MCVHLFHGPLVLSLASLLLVTGDEPRLPPPVVLPNTAQAPAAPPKSFELAPSEAARLLKLLNEPTDKLRHGAGTVAPEIAKAPDSQPKPKEDLPPTGTARIRKLLNQPTDKVKQGIDPGQSLKDVLDFIARSHGLTFRVDHKAFRAEGRDNVEELQLARGLPAVRNVPLGTVLMDLLSQLESQGTFIVRQDHIVITTVSRTTAEYTMREPVHADFEKTNLQEALKELTEQTGAAVIFDAKRAGEKAKTPITATLQNVSLGTAVQLLANMAELKAVMVDNTVYVTTEENAAKLEEEGAAAPVPHGPPPGAGAGG